MPELPEVETIRRGLAQRVINKRITDIEVHKRKLVRGQVARFTRMLAGASFGGIRRRGKLLIFSLSGTDAHLLVHLKMTGQLIYQQGDALIAGGHQWPPIDGGLPNAYSHVIFRFADGSALFFNDMRQFGFLRIAAGNELKAIEAAYGLEPLEKAFTLEAFEQAIRGRKAPIKAVLLNQQVIAGIGNIYADEACFLARVRPQRRAHTLTKKERQALHASYR